MASISLFREQLSGPKATPFPTVLEPVSFYQRSHFLTTVRRTNSCLGACYHPKAHPSLQVHSVPVAPLTLLSLLNHSSSRALLTQLLIPLQPTIFAIRSLGPPFVFFYCPPLVSFACSLSTPSPQPMAWSSLLLIFSVLLSLPALGSSRGPWLYPPSDLE